MPWLSLVTKYWREIGMTVLVFLVVLYVASLKSEIGDLKGIVADYKVEMNKANTTIDRLGNVNTDYVTAHKLAIKDYATRLETCNIKQRIQSGKENELLDLINSLRNRKPKIVETTVYKLKECKVTVSESKDTNASTLLNRLNRNFGGQ